MVDAQPNEAGRAEDRRKKHDDLRRVDRVSAWHDRVYKRRYSFTAPRARVLVRRTKLHDVLRRPVGAYASFGEACSSKGRSHSLGQIRRVGPGGAENMKGDIAASGVAANELVQRPGAGKKDASFCAGARVQQGEAAARTKCLETWSLCDIFPVAG